VQNLESKLSKLELLSVPKTAKGIGDPGGFVQTQLATTGSYEPTSAGNMIGVDMRVDNIAHLKIALS
jgi:hypothetical protein